VEGTTGININTTNVAECYCPENTTAGKCAWCGGVKVIKSIASLNPKASVKLKDKPKKAKGSKVFSKQGVLGC